MDKEGREEESSCEPKLTVKTTMPLIAFTCSPARFSTTALPRGVTVTAEYMVGFFKSTGHRFNNLKKDKISIKELLLQMDNARPHSAAQTQTYLGNTGATVLSQSPYKQPVFEPL